MKTIMILVGLLFWSNWAQAGGPKRYRFAKKKVYQSKFTASDRAQRAYHSKYEEVERLFKDKEIELGAPLFFRVIKQLNILEVWAQSGPKYKLLKTYPICYFSGNFGPKTKQGDGQVPEGIYSIAPKQLNPFSSYHLSMNIGYPNARDCIDKRTGGNIMIHGGCVSVGCLAMTDAVIEEIYTMVAISFEKGQRSIPLHIFPFRMSWFNRWRFIKYPWQKFWNELQPIYDHFENKMQLPNVIVENGRYQIASAQGNLAQKK